MIRLIAVNNQTYDSVGWTAIEIRYDSGEQ